MDKLKIFFSGFIIGLGKIMPGVSGSVLAICLGYYERIISSLSSIKHLKEDFLFFINIFLGILIAIILGSRVIKYFLDTNFIYTVSLFIGLMIPGIIPLFKEVNNKDLTPKMILLGILVLSILELFSIFSFKTSNIPTGNFLYNFISLIICGILDASATIIPGISGSALLLLVGYYNLIISSLADPFKYQSIMVLIPFGIGMILGVIIISKLMSYLFKNYRTQTLVIIIALILFSIFSLIKYLILYIMTIEELVIAIILLCVGIILSYIFKCIFN